MEKISPLQVDRGRHYLSICPLFGIHFCANSQSLPSFAAERSISLPAIIIIRTLSSLSSLYLLSTNDSLSLSSSLCKQSSSLFCHCLTSTLSFDPACQQINHFCNHHYYCFEALNQSPGHHMIRAPSVIFCTRQDKCCLSGLSNLNKHSIPSFKSKGRNPDNMFV